MADNFDGVGLCATSKSNLGSPMARQARADARRGRRCARGVAAVPRGGPGGAGHRQPRRRQGQCAGRGGRRSAAPLIACGYGMISRADGALRPGRQRHFGQPARRAAAGSGERLPPGGAAYELAYGKGLTPFLRLARNAGVRARLRTALACWWNRRPKPSPGGAACGRDADRDRPAYRSAGLNVRECSDGTASALSGFVRGKVNSREICAPIRIVDETPGRRHPCN